MHVLGLSCYFHDAAAAILRDGELVAAAEEERFSRIKHDFAFPHRAIAFCLDRAGLDAGDLDYVVFFEKPFVKFDRILQMTFQTVPRSSTVFRKAMTTWLLDKLWIKTLIRTTLGVTDDRILFCEHHLSHAASAFLCSPFDRAAILTVDGVGEWTTTALGVGEGSRITLTDEIRFPHSLGLLYSAFTAFLGFEVNEGEYKVMGMAPYGQPRYVDKVWKLIELAPDGSFALNLDYFSFHYSTTHTFSQRFVDLFGPPRVPETLFFTEVTGFPSYYGEPPANMKALAAENQHYADIAASIQRVTEDVVVALARAACTRANTTRLCMAGGVALNSVANGRLLRETPVTELYIPPAAGDGGAALGAALYAYHSVLGHPRTFVMDHASWGAAPDPAAAVAVARGSGLPYESELDDAALVARTSDLLQRGKVVGWAQGRFELGPRALGNRSILADPRQASMKDVVNAKIKFREPYRPFAPSVLAGRAAEYFDLANPEDQYAARFMLLVTPVRESARDRIPAVTHVDGTARVQTVHRTTNPLYYQLIERVGDATGVPVVMNTSFNVRGEPIVNTPAEAMSTFLRSDMDALVVDRVIVRKEA